MFSRSRPIKVFLSHKESDRKICTTISCDLKREFGNDIDIFLSSDAKCIPSGDDWQATIERQLREADWLFFLYLNPRQVWDWCFYEAGLFLGSGNVDKRRSRLVVLHPDGVVPPSPFKKIQTAGAQFEVVEQKLRQMFEKTQSGLKKSDADWRRIAEQIGTVIQAAAIQYFDGLYQLSAKCPIVMVTSEPLDVQVKVDQAEIFIKGPAQGLFGIGGQEGISWRRFGEHLNSRRGRSDAEWHRAFDFHALEGAAVCIRRDKHLGVAELQSFRVGEVGYRPIITGADMEKDGTVHLTLYLVEIPSSLDPKSTNAFDTVYQSLSLGCQLRREVVERNGIKLDGLQQNDSEAKTLLPNIWRALESVVTEAYNRGLTPERTREAFGEQAPMELEVLLEKWPLAYEAFGEATAKLDIESSKELFTVLRHINLQFLKLADSRLSQLLEKVQLPSTESMTEIAKLLLPVLPLKTLSRSKSKRSVTSNHPGLQSGNEARAEVLQPKRKAKKNSLKSSDSESEQSIRGKRKRKPK